MTYPHTHLHFRSFHQDALPPGFIHLPRRDGKPWIAFIISENDIFPIGWYSSKRNALIGSQRFHFRSRMQKLTAESRAWLESTLEGA